MTDHKLLLSKSVGSIYHRPDNTSDNMGFTLIELLMVMALIGILSTLSIPMFNDYTNKTKNGRAAAEIRTLSTEISGYALDKGSIPNTLAEINRPNYKDPWKRDYVYYNFAAPPLPLPASPVSLKDSSGISDINTDFDLYSLGQDGATAAMLDDTTDDDIARFNNGAYVGLR